MTDTDTVLTPHQRATRTRMRRRYEQWLANLPLRDRLELDMIDAQHARATALCDELAAAVDDPDLEPAITTAVWWADGRPRLTNILRAAIIDGRAVELDELTGLADHLARQADALRSLIAHVETHHPRARRRRRQHT